MRSEYLGITRIVPTIRLSIETRTGEPNDEERETMTLGSETSPDWKAKPIWNVSYVVTSRSSNPMTPVAALDKNLIATAPVSDPPRRSLFAYPRALESRRIVWSTAPIKCTFLPPRQTWRNTNCVSNACARWVAKKGNVAITSESVHWIKQPRQTIDRVSIIANAMRRTNWSWAAQRVARMKNSVAIQLRRKNRRSHQRNETA